MTNRTREEVMSEDPYLFGRVIDGRTYVDYAAVVVPTINRSYEEIERLNALLSLVKGQVLSCLNDLKIPDGKISDPNLQKTFFCLSRVFDDLEQQGIQDAREGKE